MTEEKLNDIQVVENEDGSFSFTMPEELIRVFAKIGIVKVLIDATEAEIVQE